MSKQKGEAEERLRKKQQYYEDLDAALNSDDNEAPDPGRISSIKAMRKGVYRKQQSTLTKDKNNNGLPRSVSDSNVMKGNVRSTKQNHIPPPSSSDPSNKLPAKLITRHTYAGAPSDKTMKKEAPQPSTVSKTTGKRKREVSLKQIPIEQQIFRGLNFYFFPNTDTHPARKLRIAKAVEYGAVWTKDFDETVTHVIMDKAMEYSLLLKFVKRDRLPKHVVVVSENYPSECISFKRLLDPLQLQFTVKGYEMPSALQRPSSGSDQSLQLKPAGKSVQTRRTQTPQDNRTANSPTIVSPEDDNDDDPASAPILADTSSATKLSSTEQLDIAIREARSLDHVPFDNEEEGISRLSSSDGPATDGKSQDKNLGQGKKKHKLQRTQDKFQCMQKHTGTCDTPNASTIAILQQMVDYYDKIGDQWRTRAYRKAISALRNHPRKVWTKEEALSLPQIGERLATKIEEIAFTNRLRRLDNAKAEPSDQILQTFMQVYGTGFAQASRWVSEGYTTLDELLQKADLTNNQRIGIEHYEDFNARVPRAEVEQHGNIVRKTVDKIDPACEVIVGGSYRRGSETSGDVDCIITRPNTGIAHLRQVVLNQLIPNLFAKGFLVAELAATSRDDGSKWHGACTVPAATSDASPHPWRRIDFLLVPSDELGAALIYFTGNDIFNRSLRLLASTKGMRLNQHGLYKDVIRGKGQEKLSEGALVESREERKIFAELGVPWRPPEHRRC